MKILLRSMLLLASLMLALLAAEIVLRVVVGVPVFAATNFVVGKRALNHQHQRAWIHDETLGWRIRDDYREFDNPSLGGFTTGAYGVRMNGADLVTLPKEAILAVGDSFTWGAGVANDETWSAQLESQIGQPVINAGVGGWGVDQMVLRAEHLVPLLRPRTLIVGILSQDSLRNSFEIFNNYKPYFVVKNGVAELKGVPVPKVIHHGMGLDAWRRIFGHSYLVYWVARQRGLEAQWISDKSPNRQVQADEVGVRISCLLMDRLLALRTQYGLRVIVIMQYTGRESESTEPPWYGPPVLACAEAEGFDAVDTHAPLHALSVNDPERFKALWINEDGRLGHMSAAGNQVIADLLRAQLVQ